ncbi:hypothetical protein CHI12_16765 [Terribacillus saccharophilus]|uniref:Peptidase S8/S53 domain-containing protein n=1 Tax=Terribacillus saccharophilus TaxID=361277 RepID=A0A268H912_9BACI|nr:S8 family serine peptidase [Terribacillus saccharophilus]PAE06372.1 hypothetical protein CHI12_16765 [Terribacillus saccharophilus]
MKNRIVIQILMFFLSLFLLFILVGCMQNEDIKSDTVPWGQEFVGYDTRVAENKVKIAVVDSGIDSNHPDLTGKVKQSYNALTQSNIIKDEIGHGTSVAGIITANYDGKGIVGVSQNVELIDVKVLDETGKSQIDNVIAGLEWVLEQNPDVINISFGFDKDFAPLRDIINRISEKDITILAAAGNNIGRQIQYPAEYDNVISVGSLNEKKKEDILNPTGDIDILAPGINIYTTALNEDYHTVRGSSFATAYISGILANAITNSGVSKHDSLKNKINYLQDTLEYR